MFIDSSYFVGELNIAQLGQRTVQIKLDLFISKREPEYLKTVLGFELYKAFNEGLEVDPIATKWTDLRDGADYTDASGLLQHWDGFVNDELSSPIANYVYYWFTRDNASKTTATAEKEDKTEGTVNVGPAMKQARAWNEMVCMNYKLHQFLKYKKTEAGDTVYTEFKGCNTSHDIFHEINIFNL
jgi:hypothetical protein